MCTDYSAFVKKFNLKKITLKIVLNSFNYREAVRDCYNCREEVRGCYNSPEAVRDSYNCSLQFFAKEKYF